MILPQYKTLDQILSEKPTTEALLTITSVDDEDILVTHGDSKKAKITQRGKTTKDLATETKSQTDLLQCFMDRSQDNQQRMVKALESQAKRFSEYLDFLKSRNQQAQPDGSRVIGGHPRARVRSPSYQYQAPSRDEQQTPSRTGASGPRAASTRQTRIPLHGKDTTVPQILSIRMDICLEIYKGVDTLRL